MSRRLSGAHSSEGGKGKGRAGSQGINGHPLFAVHLDTQRTESRGHFFGYPKVSDGLQRVQSDLCLPQQKFMANLDTRWFSLRPSKPTTDVHVWSPGVGGGCKGSLTTTSMLRAGACQVSRWSLGPDGAQSELLTAISWSIVTAKTKVAAVCASGNSAVSSGHIIEGSTRSAPVRLGTQVGHESQQDRSTSGWLREVRVRWQDIVRAQARRFGFSQTRLQ